MMDSLYFLASIAGIGWLLAWVLRGDAPGKPGGFWPFDMKLPPPPAAPRRGQAGPGALARKRADRS